jgi:hypothetical protein
LCRRPAAPCAVSAVFRALALPYMASLSHALSPGAKSARNRAPNSISRCTAAGRRRSPPSSAVRRRPSARMRQAPLDQDLTPSIEPPPAVVGSRSNGLDSSQPGQSGQTRQAPAFLQKTPYTLRISQKYPPTMISFLRFSPFSLF